MKKSIRLISRLAMLGSVAGTALLACSSDNRHGAVETANDSGTLKLPLSARAASGNLYRLRNASFQITDVHSGQTTAFLSSEDDPNSTLLTTVLQASDYTITLLPGWNMERVIDTSGTGGSTSFGGSAGEAGFFGFAGSDFFDEAQFDAAGAPSDAGAPPEQSGGRNMGVGGRASGGKANSGGASSAGRGSVGGSPFASGGAANGGSTGAGTFVEATLLSDATQFFNILGRSDSFVNYSFQIGGDVLQFNQGRLNVSISVTEAEQQCDTPPNVTRAERVLLENDTAALGNVRLRDVFQALAANGRFEGDGSILFQEIYDSYASAANARLPDAVHCDDELTDGAPSLNGYPIDCDRIERFHIDNIDKFFATAIVNRMDLAPANGANCGQQRMVFADPSRGRAFMILEAQIPNPTPELGIKGCLPLAQFWMDQNSIDDPFARGQRLLTAFLSGDPGLVAQGFGPFYTPTNLTVGSGQIRTNQFDQFPWMLREFKLALDGGELKAIPFPTAEAPHGELWNEKSALPQAAACRESFLGALDGLLTNDLDLMTFVVDQSCRDSESRDDFSQFYGSQLTPGFAVQLNDKLRGTGLTAQDIANRATFAGSCIGCHNESQGSSLGNGLQAPPREDFPHVLESVTDDCGSGNPGAKCFQLSTALKTVFLPSRLNTLTNLLGVPIVTDPCSTNSGAGGSTSGPPKGGTGGRVGIDDPAGPAPRVNIQLPQASTPVSELLKEDGQIRALNGKLTISGRSAQSTH